MGPFFFLTFLWWARAGLIVVALLSLCLNHYLYGLSRQSIHDQLTPLAAIIPLVTTLIALFVFSFTGFSPAMGIIAATMILSCFFFNPHRVISAALCGGVAITGCLIQDSTMHAYQQLLAEKPRTIEAIVTETSAWLGRENGTILTLQVTAIDGYPCSTALKCLTLDPKTPALGALIATRNIQIQPEQKKSALDAYQKRDDCCASIFMPRLWFRLQTPEHPTTIFAVWCAKRRAALYARIMEKLPPTTQAYCGALFFGNKQHAAYGQIKRKFSRWGITHYLARSGLHITLIIWLWSILLAFLGLPTYMSISFLFMLLMLYHFLSWPSISFYRALFLWMLWAAGIAGNKSPHGLYIFSFFTLAIILVNPAYAQCIDFQLSFFLSGVLILRNFIKKQLFLLSYCRR